MLPAELVLVRHGQSEANLIQQQAKQESVAEYEEEIRRTRAWRARLTRLGREQAAATGAYLAEEFPNGFDRNLFSYFVRTQETAAHLALPHAEWDRNASLHEQDWGDFDNFDFDMLRNADFRAEMERRYRDPLFWKPPRGESIMEVSVRFDRLLDTLHREVESEKIDPETGKAILVTHGGTMEAARIPLERMDEVSFFEWSESDDPHDKHHNGQVVHYTRRTDPENPDSALASKLLYRRSICPSDRSKSSDAWVEIKRPRYTNEQMLEGVEHYPRLIETD